MVEDRAKPVFSNITVSDVFVPVDVGAERRFGIVGMDDGYIIDATDPVDFGDGFLKVAMSGTVAGGRML